MSQLRLGYEQFQANGAEVLAVTATPSERGQQYNRMFKFVHPYLCDPERQTILRYGVGARAFSLRESLSAVKPSMWRHYASGGGVLKEKELAAQESGAGLMDGLLIIDQQGIVRYVSLGNAARVLPSNAEIVEMLTGLPATGS